MGGTFCNCPDWGGQTLHNEGCALGRAATLRSDDGDLTTAYMVGYEKGKDAAAATIARLRKCEEVCRMEGHPHALEEKP